VSSARASEEHYRPPGRYGDERRPRPTSFPEAKRSPNAGSEATDVRVFAADN
jgi:hypothetical protein